MLKYIFIGFIVVLTIWTVYIYYEKGDQDAIELQRIKRIEAKIEKIHKLISYYRMNTQECKVVDLITPRQCYIGSNKTCVWHVGAKRCNQIPD